MAFYHKSRFYDELCFFFYPPLFPSCFRSFFYAGDPLYPVYMTFYEKEKCILMVIKAKRFQPMSLDEGKPKKEEKKLISNHKFPSLCDVFSLSPSFCLSYTHVLNTCIIFIEDLSDIHKKGRQLASTPTYTVYECTYRRLYCGTVKLYLRLKIMWSCDKDGKLWFEKFLYTLAFHPQESCRNIFGIVFYKYQNNLRMYICGLFL